MTDRVDVAVIGGGLLGWSTAYRLAKRGRRVTVIDRADRGYATQAGAGIIAPGASLAAPEPFYTLAKLGVDEYDRLIPELAEDGETGTDYARVGMLFLARDEAEWARLPEALRRMTTRKAAGMGNLGELTVVDDATARAMFPPVMPIAGAIHVAGAARVNGKSLRDALRAGALRHGAAEMIGSATVERDDELARVAVDGSALPAETVVLAGGAWSRDLAEALGFALPLYPQRGQILHLDLPGTETGGWPILEWFGSHYMLTFPGGRVVAGATREHDSGFDPRLTAGGVRELLEVALGVAPGLAPATVAEIRVGLRPFSPDGLPVLGWAPGVRNLALCTGHGPSGLQLGPASGAIVAGLIDGEQPPLDLAPYGPERYQSGVAAADAAIDTMR